MLLQLIRPTSAFITKTTGGSGGLPSRRKQKGQILARENLAFLRKIYLLVQYISFIFIFLILKLGYKIKS